MIAKSETPSHDDTVGFAGLGSMGYGMVANMLKKGIKVVGFDPSPVACERVRALGGFVPASIAESSAGRSKYFVMVATPEQVDDLVFGKDGLSQNLPIDAILVLCSTLPPRYVTDIPARLTECGRGDLKILDCPVSGGAVGAAKGELSIMISGNKPSYQLIEPELKAIASAHRLFYCGDLGAASMIKMLNQHLAGTHIVVAAEVLAFAKALGLSTEQTHKIITSGVGSSWIFGDRGINMLRSDWTPRSAVTIFTKDLGIVADAADQVLLPAPIACQALLAFTERAKRGYGGTDDASVVCNYEDIIGQTVAERNQSVDPETNGVLAKTSPLEGAWRLQDTSTTAAGFTAFENHFVPGHTSIETPGLFIHFEGRGTRDELPSLLKALPRDSIVAVAGLHDEFESKTFVDDVAEHHQEIRFIDCQVVLPINGTTSAQFLFTADHPETAEQVTRVLPPGLVAQPVYGKFGSATVTYLLVRLASLLHVAAAAECYSLAVAQAVSVNRVYQLIAGAAGSSAQFNRYYPDMMNQNFALSPADSRLTEDTLQNAIADLTRLRAASTAIRFPARLLDITFQIYKSVFRKQGAGRLSVASVAKFWS